MSDRLPPKGMCSESHNLCKFGEISDNISETVQDRDMVAMEVSKEIVFGLSNETIANALE